MNRRPGIRWIAIAAWTAGLLAGGVCPALAGATLQVPEDFRTVTEAVAASSPGDRIEVAAGLYSAATGERFPLEFAGRDVTLSGAGAGRCVLHGGGVTALLRFRDGDRSVVDGFTLSAGHSPDDGGAVLVDGASPELLRLRFVGNRADRSGNAIAIDGGVPRLSNCLFEANGTQGPTIVVRAGSPLIELVTLHGNAGPALETHDDASPLFRAAIVSRPGTGGGEAIGIRVITGRGLGTLVLEHNLFSECYDGTVAIHGNSEAVVASIREDARRADGLREGDPLFRNPARGDYTLAPGSPARLRRDGPAEIGAFGGHSPLVLAGQAEVRAGGGTEHFLLGPSVPNPFTPATTIHFTVEGAGAVDLGVYNVLGQRIRTLLAGSLPEGEHTRDWDGRDDLGADAPPGIYFVRITHGEVTESRRVVLVR